MNCLPTIKKRIKDRKKEDRDDDKDDDCNKADDNNDDTDEGYYSITFSNIIRIWRYAELKKLKT